MRDAANETAADYPPLPRPSPSHTAYREDPEGFLERLDARAARLFEDGYRALPAPSGGDAAREQRAQEQARGPEFSPHAFLVTHSGRHGTVCYRVDAWRQTCDCPFHARQRAGERLGEDDGEEGLIACKHLRGLPALVRKSRQELYRAGKVAAYCALSVHWLRFLAALRRQRIRKERVRQAQRTTQTAVPGTSPGTSPGTLPGVSREGEREARKAPPSPREYPESSDYCGRCSHCGQPLVPSPPGATPRPAPTTTRTTTRAGHPA